MDQDQLTNLKPGDRFSIRSQGIANKITLRFSDGTAVETKVGPGESIAVIVGTLSCTVDINDLDDPSTGPKIVTEET